MFETRNKVLNINIAKKKKKQLSYELAQLVGTKNVDKDVLCILKTETGDEVFFNKKYQKYFTDDVEYRVHDSKSPIRIYSNGVFMGIILPVYVRE